MKPNYLRKLMHVDRAALHEILQVFSGQNAANDGDNRIALLHAMALLRRQTSTRQSMTITSSNSI